MSEQIGNFITEMETMKRTNENVELKRTITKWISH